MPLPILYSFRRCPYAIRARMALASSGAQVELREILLKNKPASMLQTSAKGTVPVLQLVDGTVLDESLEVMQWALEQSDPDGFGLQPEAGDAAELLRFNDDQFKPVLDRYKYADRYPERSVDEYRQESEVYLENVEQKLSSHQFLAGDQLGFVDIAVFPFIRQFAYVDIDWFEGSSYQKVQQWLHDLLSSTLFLRVMEKYPMWQEGDTRIVFPPKDLMK